MLGRRPYQGTTPREYIEKILARGVTLKPEEKPNNWSHEASDLINKLLQRKEELRLGYKSPQEVKDHPWFKTINWEDLLYKKLTIRGNNIRDFFLPESLSIDVLLVDDTTKLRNKMNTIRSRYKGKVKRTSANTRK